MARHRTVPPPTSTPAVRAGRARGVAMPLQVLVVATQALPQKLLRGVERRLGKVCFTHAGSGAVGIELAAVSANVDVLLVDAVLCDMSATEFCAALTRRVGAPAPVLVMTTTTALAGDLGLPGTDAGVLADYLVKPLRELELSARIRLAASATRNGLAMNALQGEVTQLRRERTDLRVALTELQTRDPGTGLFNRACFRQALESALASGESSRSGALAIVNLDRFRHLLGDIGDGATARVLARIAALLRSHFGDDAIVGRLGANELAALHPGRNSEQAALAAEAVRLAISALGGEAGDHPLSASIGVTPLDAAPPLNADEAIARARQASFVARQRGGNLVHSYRADDPELDDQRDTAHWGARIRHALANGGFRLVFQPVMRIADCVVDHYEVLIRMLGERGQLLPPPSFIPIAERTGLIHDIDRWVVGATIGLLHRLGGVRADLSFNINLSGRAFQDQLLLPFICQRLEETGVDPHRITFEITETAAIANIGSTQEMVAKLRSLGCQFALDDFGAGFASYSYLKQLQVDVLKIDGAFIRNLASDTMDQVLVRSMVDIARRLGKRTVAEFVGDQRTLDLLAEYGVDYAQGYFIGKPSSSILPAATGLHVGVVH